MAFSKDFLVMMSLVVIPCFNMLITASPANWARGTRLLSTAEGDDDPGSDIPIASDALAIVFAVYIPPQVPALGQAAFSIRSKSSSDMSPRAFAPTASKDVTIFTFISVPSSSLVLPGSSEPAYIRMLGTLIRAAAINIAGILLSHPARVTIASKRSACITVSTESAITSRLTSEKCIPS